MKSLVEVSFLVLTLLVVAIPSFGKEWKEIVPLKTTRGEVITKLGLPKPSGTAGPEYFEFENQRIEFQWVRADCYMSHLRIDEKSADDSSLVYQFTVEPIDPRTNLYEGEVRQFLADIGSHDCTAPSHGECGVGDLGQVGFGYSRSPRGITRLNYQPTSSETVAWVRSAHPCSEKPPPSRP